MNPIVEVLVFLICVVLLAPFLTGVIAMAVFSIYRLAKENNKK